MLRVLSLSPDALFCNAFGMITMEGPIRLDRELTALAVKDGRMQRWHGWRRALRSLTCRAPS